MTRAVSAPPASRTLTWGCVWGLTVTLAEALLVARGSRHAPVGWLILWFLPAWSLTGCALVAAIVRAEARCGARGVAAAWLGVSVATAAMYVALSASAWTIVSARADEWPAVQTEAAFWLATPAVRGPLFVYHTWTNLFFGGLLALALAFDLRTERIRSSLHLATLARSRASLAAGKAQLESIRARVDPALLVDTLAEVRQRFDVQPAAGEQLLDALVAFLRAAMPGLRRPVSDLDAELQLARSYADLQHARRMPVAWEVDDAVSSSARMAPFPAQIMPVLLACGGEAPRLEARDDASSPGIVRIAAHGLVEPAPTAVARLRFLLSRIDGQATVSLQLSGTRGFSLVLEFHPRRT